MPVIKLKKAELEEKLSILSSKVAYATLYLQRLRDEAHTRLNRVNMQQDNATRRYITDYLGETRAALDEIQQMLGMSQEAKSSLYTFNLIGWVKHDDGELYQMALLWEHRDKIQWPVIGNVGGYLVAEFFRLEDIERFCQAHNNPYVDFGVPKCIWLPKQFVIKEETDEEESV